MAIEHDLSGAYYSTGKYYINDSMIVLYDTLSYSLTSNSFDDRFPGQMPDYLDITLPKNLKFKFEQKNIDTLYLWDHDGSIILMDYPKKLVEGANLNHPVTPWIRQ